MRISSRFGTAIHTLLVIHERSQTQKITSEFIAQQTGVIPVTIRKLLGDFKKAGIVKIAPRKEKEGTTIARSFDQITLFDILMVVEPNLKEEVVIPNTRNANTCYSGLYVNEAITEYVDVALNAVYNEFKKITMEEVLATLLKKESGCPHDPRAPLSKTDLQRINKQFKK